MKQLIMNWKNDGTPAVAPVYVESVKMVRFTELDNALNEWLSIMRYMCEDTALPDESLYHDSMTKRELYKPEFCFFLTVDGTPAASITVICDYEKKHGYIHMVCAKPEARGKGLGKSLNDLALYTLKTEGMETAHLTTDDFRIPAIKSYLKAGFTPDTETQPDFKERWNKIFEIIG